MSFALACLLLSMRRQADHARHAVEQARVGYLVFWGMQRGMESELDHAFEAGAAVGVLTKGHGTGQGQHSLPTATAADGTRSAMACT